MKEEIKDKTWYEEVKEDFVKNISDTYTLNLAISILEDRKELLDKNLDLQSQLKAKEEENEQLKADYGNLAQVERDFLKEVIKEAREYVEKTQFYDNNNYFKNYLLKILSKGENK